MTKEAVKILLAWAKNKTTTKQGEFARFYEKQAIVEINGLGMKSLIEKFEKK